MGAVHSRSSRAAEFDVRELHGIAFRRALRKQDRRLERDAAVLRRRRGGASGSSRRRDGDERPRRGSDARGTREDDGDSNEGSDDEKNGMTMERRRVAEEMRALRLECARRDAKARQRREAERERRRADRKERGQHASHSNRVQRTETRAAKKRVDEEDARARANEDGEDEENSGLATFDELIRACSVDEETARSTARRRHERERRREAIVQRGRSSGETSARREEERKKKGVVANDGGSANDARDADADADADASPTVCPHDELPFAAAAAAAAAAERRTFLLNPPGASRGGLRERYEQVKVFRDGDSLFQCAFLAELVLRHEETALFPDSFDYFDRRDRSAMRHAETVAAVLRRGVRALGRAETEETTLALRAGAAARIAEAHADVATDGAFPGATPLPTLRDDFDVDAIDAAVVTAVNGAELLNKNMSLCPPRGAPLDTWRRAMNEVGSRAEAELPETDDFSFSDASDDEEDDFYSTRRTDVNANETVATRRDRRRDSRQRRFESAVRNVRRAYADEVARPGVPSSSLEVAALAAHLRRPIAVIRGPSRALLGADATGSQNTETVRPSAWRARCASETFGAAHARRGRRGFAVFWELAENVPDGLPAGDFSLLLPRREGEDDDASRASYASETSYESETDDSKNEARVSSALDGFCSESDASDVSLGSVDDLLRGHAARSRRFAKSGFWSDRTPLASASENEACSSASDAGSLWNSESEASFDLESEREREGDLYSSDETRDASAFVSAETRRRRDAPSFLR